MGSHPVIRMLKACIVLVVNVAIFAKCSSGVEIGDGVDIISNEENELNLPWKHIVQKVKIEKEELDRERIRKREEAKVQLENKRKEALKFMNTFFNEFFSDDFYEEDYELRPPTKELERIEQVSSDMFTPDTFSTKDDNFFDYDNGDYIQPIFDAITEASIT